MAASEILADGTGDANSSEVTVSTAAKLVCLKHTGGGPRVSRGALAYVEVKDDDGEFYIIGHLNSQAQSMNLSTPGVYRVRRPVGSSSIGVFVA